MKSALLIEYKKENLTPVVSAGLKGVLYSLCKASQVTLRNRLSFYVDENIMIVN